MQGKGIKEILVSLAIGFASLTAYQYMTGATAEQADRHQGETAPTQFTGLPDDPALALRWASLTIDLPNAWIKNKGRRDVVVAIIDTGCDINHPALKESIWINPGENGMDENGNSKKANGVDDDGNGFVDDIHGWNFVESSSVVMDDHGHGTHIAGIIGAKDGVAPGVSLMILKYYDPESGGSNNLAYTIAAIKYAVKMGANIINYSGGGIMRSPEEEDALSWARSQGVLVTAAAGNDGLNTDFFHFYPADYDLDNLISVAASDRQNQLMMISNFGLQTVDIAAPGKNIYSTLPGGAYGYMTGTSQATAFVSGVAALLISANPTLKDPQTVIAKIMESGTFEPALKNKLKSARILNAEQALNSVYTQVARTPAQN